MFLARRRNAFAFCATHESLTAAQVSTVRHMTGGFFTDLARGKFGGSGGEVDGNSAIEDVKRTLPQPIVALGLAVAHDAAVDLVDLGETAGAHQWRQNLAPNPSGAIGDDRFVLEVVVLATFKLGDKVSSRRDVGNHGIFELANPRFKCVAPVEEHDIIAALGDERIDLVGSEFGSASDDPGFINDNLVGNAKTNDLGASLHAQPRKIGAQPVVIEARAVAPLHVEVRKSRVLLRLADVLLDVLNRSADGAVDSVRRYDDSPSQLQRLAQL